MACELVMFQMVPDFSCFEVAVYYGHGKKLENDILDSERFMRTGEVVEVREVLRFPAAFACL